MAAFNRLVSRIAQPRGRAHKTSITMNDNETKSPGLPAKLRRVVALVFAGWLLACAAAAATSPGARPNIIFILSDDVGIVNHSTYGGGFKTPNVDALAQKGVKFNFCYSSPLCGPSRFQALTGRYPFRTGHITNMCDTFPTPKEEVMLPTVMKQAGYATLCIGKWGQISHNAGAWGFDEYLTYLNEDSNRYWGGANATYLRNGKEVPFGVGEYLPDIQHKFMLDFIDRQKGKRFFVYYPMIQIHTPLLRTPDTKPGAKEGPQEEQIYRDNIAYLDKLIGRLVADLEQRGLLENTLIIYCGDNGAQRNFINIETINGRNIAGCKGMMNEGGSRVPLIAYWKGVTPAGRVLDDLTDFTDVFPTIAEIAGAPLPKVKLDGRSFAPQLRGEKGNPRDWVAVQFNREAYVRDARYKLTSGGELFDLKNAPFEEIPVNLNGASSEVRAAQAKLNTVLAGIPAAEDTPKGARARQEKSGKKKQGTPRNWEETQRTKGGGAEN